MFTEMLYPGSKIRVDNDHFNFLGEFTVKEVYFKPNTTGVLVHLLSENNEDIHTVIPYNQIWQS